MDRFKICVSLLGILCLVVLCNLRCGAQNYVNYSWLKNSDGLIQNTPQEIIEDELGNLWMGSNGIDRYDGYTIKHYDQHNSKLTSSKIWDFALGQNNQIWIATDVGLWFYDPPKDDFTLIENKIGDKILRRKCAGLLSVENGIWVGYFSNLGDQDGLSFYDYSTQTFTNYFDDELLEIDEIALYPGDATKLLASGNGLGLILDLETQTVDTMPMPKGIAAEGFYARDVAVTNDSIIWIASPRYGLFYCSVGDFTLKPYNDDLETNKKLKPKKVFVKNDELWIASLDLGVARVSFGEEIEYSRLLQGNILNLMPRTHCLFIGEAGASNWFGTAEGVVQVDAIEPIVDVLQINYPSDQLSPDCKIQVAHYLAEPNEIAIIRNGKTEIQIVDANSGTSRAVFPLVGFDNEEIKFIRYHTEIFDFKGGFLLTYGRYILKYTYADRTLKPFYQLPEDIDDYYPIREIKQDPKGRFWVMVQRGVLIGLNQNGKEFFRNDKPKQVGNVLEYTLGSGMAIQKKKMKLFAFWRDGILEVDLENLAHEVVNFKQESLIDGHLDGTILQLNDSICVITLINDGEYHIDLNKKEFLAPFGEIEKSDVIYYWSQWDGKGSIWTPSNSHLKRYDIKNGLQKKYNERNGLSQIKFNAKTRHLDTIQQIMYLPEYFDVLRLYLDRLTLPKKPCQPILNEFLINGKPLQGDTVVNFLNTLYFEPNENVISFEMGAANLIHQDLTFAYRLKGLSDQWTTNQKPFGTSFTNLAAGKYTLEYKVETDAVPIIRSLELNIAAHWYKTKLFYILLFLTISAIVYGLFKYRLRQVRKQAALKSDFEKRLSEMEMTALRAQMNPHFLFNCLNSIKFFIIKNEREEAADYLTKFSRLIRLILNNSKKDMVPLDSELESLGLYIEMEQLRFTQKFTFKISCPENIHASEIEIPPLLLQPYVENSIWHGLMHSERPGHIGIDISQNDGDLEICISDNGVGRKASSEMKSKTSTKNKSYGMQITQDRLKTIEERYGRRAAIAIKDLFDENGQPTGTKVDITIPVH